MNKILIALIFPVILLSCISSGEDIIVNKDGSGQIIQTFKIKKDYVGFLNLSDQPSDPNLINMDELTAAASKLGEGVILEKVVPMSEDSPFAGYSAYYSFQDITKIKANASPSTSPEVNDDNPENVIHFQFTQGNTSSLRIIMPKNETDKPSQTGTEDSGNDIEQDKTADDGMADQLKQIYKDMHYWIRVSVKGDIVETDARHVEKSTVTILDMSFDKIVDNADLFAKITADDSDKNMDAYIEELTAAGVLIEDKDIVSVEFK